MNEKANNGLVAQTARSLRGYLDEFFNPGDQIGLFFEVSKPVSQEVLDKASDVFRKSNLVADVQYGSTPWWPDVVYIRFHKPSRRDKLASGTLHALLLNVFQEIGIREIKKVGIA